MGEDDYFERHLARLLIALYYSGTSVTDLISGTTRQVDSLWRLQQFDFWLREPGHLAFALLHAYAANPSKFTGEYHDKVRTALERMLSGDLVDTRRVALPGSPYNIIADLDANLSFLTGCALLSDRPSFARSATHQIVLETPGIELVQKILGTCPTFEWYRAQGELITDFFPFLEQYDLGVMPYLAPDFTPVTAAAVPLAASIRARHERIFGDSRHVDV